MFCSGYLNVFEKILVSFCGDWRCHFEWSVRGDLSTMIYFNIAMGRDRRNGQKEWILGLDSVLEEPFRFLGYHIGRIVTLMAHGRIGVSLPGAVQVGVSKGVQQKVRARPTGREWLVVILDGMCIEQLSRVICSIASFLEPDGKIMAV